MYNMNDEFICIPVGVDDGHDEIKITLPSDISLRMPSNCKVGDAKQISIHGNSRDIFTYRTESGFYSVGNIDKAESTEFTDYPLSDMNRVLVHHALRIAGYKYPQSLSVCTGLPLKRFYRNGLPNKKLILGKVKNLLNNDIISGDGYELAKIASHAVVAEGIGAWIDLVIFRNDAGMLEINHEKAQKKIAIIDIGGSTTEIAVIRDWNLDNARSTTMERCGMLEVKQALADEILDRYDIHLNEEEKARAINTEKIMLWGKEIDVSSIVNRAVAKEVARIKVEAAHCLGKGSDLDEIQFVGGSVNVMKSHLMGWYPNQTEVVNPGFANSRGFQKYAEFTMSQ